jgi:hypothetical protein
MNQHPIPVETLGGAMPSAGLLTINTQQQEDYVRENFPQRKTSVFERIAQTIAAAITLRTPKERTIETLETLGIEKRLRLFDSRAEPPADNKNAAHDATRAALLIRNPDEKEAVASRLAGHKREVAVLAYQLNVKTVAPISSKQDDASTDEAAKREMLDIAQRGSEGVVVVGSTSADAMIHENSAAQEAQQEVRAEQSLNLFTEEEQRELQRWQQLATATNFENNYVLTEWRTAIMTIYQQREQNGTLNSEITQELVSQVGAISARIGRNNEAANTMTMQPA